MIIKTAEILFLLGVICFVLYVSTSSRRSFLKSVEPAIRYLASLVDGVQSSRWYYLGGPIQIKGKYRGRSLVASFDLAQCRLVLTLRITQARKGGLFAISQIEEGVERADDRLITYLDYHTLQDVLAYKGYLDERLAHLDGLARQIEDTDVRV